MWEVNQRRPVKRNDLSINHNRWADISMIFFQQRRLFQTAKSSDVTNNSGASIIPVRIAFRPCGRIAAILTALLFLTSSCSSLTPERVHLLASIALQAAQIGAQVYLAKHPDKKPWFDAVTQAASDLMRLERTPQVIEMLQNLPTDTLSGKDGEVYITEKRIVIWDSTTSKATVAQGKAESPVLKATVLGLKRASHPLPPLPKGFRFHEK